MFACRWIASRAVSVNLVDRFSRWEWNLDGACITAALAAAVSFGAVRDGTAEGKKQRKKNVSNCCGIVGYIGGNDSQRILMDGLVVLQNRGYDSCGMTTVSEGKLHTSKYASKGSTHDSIDILEAESPKNHLGHRIGIAHTRWATHGAKTDDNAHPHVDEKNRISLVHNGTIDNYSSLKAFLLEKGWSFKSETDSEVIANLISYYLDDPEATFESAVRSAVYQLQGTWGLAVLHKDYDDTIVLARNGSPLVLGSHQGQVFVASEASALARHTNRTWFFYVHDDGINYFFIYQSLLLEYLSLKDGEIVVVTRLGIPKLSESRTMQQVEQEQMELSPAPFEHWTIKEIFEQSVSLARALNHGGRLSPHQNRIKLGGMEANREALLTIEHLLIAGCGTSLYAGLYGELLLEWLRAFSSVKAVDASELEHTAFPETSAGLLLISQSGETRDTLRACNLAEYLNVPRFSVVNTVGSLLARSTNCGVYVNAGREVAVASTKAFTSQVTVLSLLGAWFAQEKKSAASLQRRQILLDSVHRLPVYAGMTMNCYDQVKLIARKIKEATTLFVLGKGFGYPVALEGALKIKEVSYIHAEGFAGGALKHGPFALIDDKKRTPVVLLVLGDKHLNAMLNAARQIRARGAHLICITDEPSMVAEIADDVIQIPSNGPLTALIGVIPLQLLAYSLAVEKGINPDKPRGLAKTVTVS